ncbi:MAG: hypothetical protein LDL53_00595 [Candidatus Hydrogenedens sp.]|nr:hypothetical protein [Candidatus Hydrogenedens sp.]
MILPPLYLSPLIALCLAITNISAQPSQQQTDMLKQAQQKILNYVHTHKSQFRVEDLILLDYLYRRFNLDNEFSFKHSFTRIPSRQDIQSLEVYGRLVNYTSIPWKKPIKAEPFIWMEIQALFIEKQDDCPSKQKILSILKKQLYEGSYSTTHTALALGWFIEQGCLSETDPEVIQFKQEITHQLLNISQTITYPTDLKTEALAFICYLGEKNNIDANNFIQLLTYQRDDGAFSGTKNPNVGINVHTTLLMLWLTYEFLNKQTNYSEPMILPIKKKPAN